MKFWNVEKWEVLKFRGTGYLNHGSCKNKNGPRNFKTVTDYKLPDGSLVTELELTKGYYTLIDTEDLDLLCQYNWCASKSNGEVKRAMCKKVLLHQVLSEKYFNGQVVDHINKEFPESYELDNRKSNLRLLCKSANAKNLSRLKSNNTTGHSNIRRNTSDTCWTLALRHKKISNPTINFPDKQYRDGLTEAIAVRDLLKVWLIEDDLLNTQPSTEGIDNLNTLGKIVTYVKKVRKEEMKK